MSSEVTRATLGVDGGQSTIRVRHSGGAAGSAPGVSWGAGDTVTTTASAVIAAWRDAGSPPASAVVLGLSTVPETGPERERLARAVSESTGAVTIAVCDDAVTSHVGALDGCWGVALSIGTGVACASRAEASERIQLLGGHGYLLGDEGGGFWIGACGITAVLRATEKRSPATMLTGEVEGLFGPLAGLPIRLHADPRAVDRIARFATVVLDCAREGDAVSAGIADRAVTELDDLLDVAWRTAGERESTPLVLQGRLAHRLADGLTARASRRPGRFDVVDARGDALDGALRIAEDPDGLEPIHVIRRKQ